MQLARRLPVRCWDQLQVHQEVHLSQVMRLRLPVIHQEDEGPQRVDLPTIAGGAGDPQITAGAAETVEAIRMSI